MGLAIKAGEAVRGVCGLAKAFRPSFLPSFLPLSLVLDYSGVHTPQNSFWSTLKSRRVLSLLFFFVLLAPECSHLNEDGTSG